MRFSRVQAGSILFFLWSGLCAIQITAPILAAHSHNAVSALIYLLFSSACHQIPERSFMLAGYPLAVCHRCFGIYLGLCLGSLLKIDTIHRSPSLRKFFVLAATAPLFLDFLLSCFGLWTNTAASRFSTGLLFGLMLSSLLVRGVAELLDESSRLRFKLIDAYVKGGFS
jgi:uncharacterized membrane protein